MKMMFLVLSVVSFADQRVLILLVCSCREQLHLTKTIFYSKLLDETSKEGTLALAFLLYQSTNIFGKWKQWKQ